jgi:hypothetical protein
LVELRFDGGANYFAVRSTVHGCELGLVGSERCVVVEDPIFGSAECDDAEYLPSAQEILCNETQGAMRCECPSDGGPHALLAK